MRFLRALGSAERDRVGSLIVIAAALAGLMLAGSLILWPLWELAP